MDETKLKANTYTSLFPRVAESETDLRNLSANITGVRGDMEKTTKAVEKVATDMWKIIGNMEKVAGRMDRVTTNLSSGRTAGLVGVAKKIEDLQKRISKVDQEVAVSNRIVEFLSQSRIELARATTDLTKDITKLEEHMEACETD